MAEFEFLDPGPLVDGDLELVLAEQRPADPAKNRTPAYTFRMQLHGVEEAGRINLCIGNQEALVRYGGHIGCGVNPEYRGQYDAACAGALSRHHAGLDELVRPLVDAASLDLLVAEPSEKLKRRLS